MSLMERLPYRRRLSAARLAPERRRDADADLIFFLRRAAGTPRRAIAPS